MQMSKAPVSAETKLTAPLLGSTTKPTGAPGDDHSSGPEPDATARPAAL